MTIEFSCPECGKPLSTTDDKAGRSAKCPGCGERLTVPGRSPPATESDLENTLPSAGGSAGSFSEEQPQSDSVRKPCPVCGELILAQARVCRFCGEQFAGVAKEDPEGLRADLGVIWEQAWEVYKNNLGLSVGLYVLTILIQFAANLPQQALNVAQRQLDLNPLIYGPSMLAAVLLSNGVQFWLGAGYAHCMLKLARGDVPQIAELFWGGRWFWRTVGSGIVFVLAVSLGTLLCILPGIFIALRLWPYLYFIVDEDDGVTDAFNRSWNLTRDQYGLGLLLGLCAIGLNLAGVLMLCVGVLFTFPLTALLAAMTYLALRADFRRKARDVAPDESIA